MTNPDTLPDPEAFRSWLQHALTALSLSPAGYGPSLGLGKNTLGHFLSVPGRDLTLGTASKVVADLRSRAERDGVDIRPLPRLQAGVAGNE
ncbi:hypothetical protein [Salipiger thiooxidans]|jgi:hypothetical protein|uniref:hypothetical protein n=1 Tax=Salipiger thiooxidans TaxID=282683 RepID=UPI001CD35F07|nr:hypothetical protein [Salipiger thiooxidans]MCA0851218.1 hypothetical protein [Salipiger thiooxidans]